MGIFNLFKNNKPKPTAKKPESKTNNPKTQITFQETINIPKYDPWEPQDVQRNENYSIAGMLKCADGGSVHDNNDNYPRYLSYRYNIFNPVEYHKQMIAEGYLTEITDAATILDKFRVAELKSILEEHQLPSKGRKDTLIQTIIDNIDINTLKIKKYYTLTQKGIDHLEKFHYVFAVQPYDILPETYEEYAKEYKYKVKENDIIWRILNDCFNKYSMEQCYGLAANTLYKKAQFLIKENRFVDAENYLISVLYYELSGTGNSKYIEPFDSLILPPGITEQIIKYKEYYKPEMIDRAYRYDLPHHYFSKEQFQRIVIDILDGKSIELKDYL